MVCSEQGSLLWSGQLFLMCPPVLYVLSVVVNLGGGVSPGHPLVLYVRWVSRIGRCLLSRLERAWWPMTGLGTVWREPGAQPTTLDPSSSQPNVNASRPKHKRKTQTHKRKTQTHERRAQTHKIKTQTQKEDTNTQKEDTNTKGRHKHTKGKYKRKTEKYRIKDKYKHACLVPFV